MAGKQGRNKGEVSPPVNSKMVRNVESVSAKAFELRHSKGGVLSLCLAENDDEDEVKLSSDYHNVEFLITTGPGPVPDLDSKNIVFGSVLEGEDFAKVSIFLISLNWISIVCGIVSLFDYCAIKCCDYIVIKSFDLFD